MATLPVYSKNPLSIEQSLHRLWLRNLIIDDRAKAEHALRTIGYFRLLIYMRKFQAPNGNFFSQTKFTSLLKLYEVDRSLRTISMEATERVELALRVTLGHSMAVISKSPHWYMDENHYESFEAYYNVVGQVLKESKKTSNIGAQHYFAHYSAPRMPPSWQVCQKITFGALSRMYSGLKIDRRKKLALEWGLRENLLISWFRTVTTLRNECAHHGRLWQAALDVDKPMAHNLYAADFASASSFYARACATKLLLDSVGHGVWWRQSLLNLLASSTNINPAQDYGFLPNWSQRPLWT